MHLSGAAYPASKAALLRYAEAHHATNILPVMKRLPEQQYNSALEVVKAVIAPSSPLAVPEAGRPDGAHAS